MVTSNTTGTTGTTNKPGSTQSSDIKNDLDKSKDEMSQKMKGTREEVTKEAGDQARTKAEGVKGYAADEMEDLSTAAEAAADALHDEHHEKLSAYVGDMAGYVNDMASSLRSKNVDDLVSDAKRMAHKNPSLFIAGGIALGLGIARIAKAGTSRTNQHTSSTQSLPSSSASYGSSDYGSSTSGTTGSSSTGSTSSVGSSSSLGSTSTDTSSVGSSFSSSGGTSTTTPGSSAKSGSLNSGFNTKSSQYDKV